MDQKIDLWTLLLFLLLSVSGTKAGGCIKPVLEGSVLLTDASLMQDGYPDGIKLTLECGNGYKVERGPDIITCVNGNWSEVELKCKKKDCGPPKPIPHVTYVIEDGTLFGAAIKPVCDTGYYLQGSSHIRCLVPGWVGHTQCLLFTCDILPEIHNGVRDFAAESFKYGDVINYSCMENYTLIGNSSISCLENGKYSSEVPQCVETNTTYTEPKTTTSTTLSTETIELDLGETNTAYTEPKTTISTNLSNETIKSDLRETIKTYTDPKTTISSNLSTEKIESDVQGKEVVLAVGIFLLLLIFVVCIVLVCIWYEKRKGVRNRTTPG